MKNGTWRKNIFVQAQQESYAGGAGGADGCDASGSVQMGEEAELSGCDHAAGALPYSGSERGFALGNREKYFSEKNDPIISEEVMRRLRTCENPLAIIFGIGLVGAFAKTQYVTFIENQRMELAAKGILMPVVHIMDRSELAENEWMIVAYNRILFDEKIESMPEDLGLYMAETLGKTVAGNYGYILNRDLVCAIVENLGTVYPVLIEGVVPEKVSYALLQNVMSGLWERGHNAVCYMIKIIEKLESCLYREPDISEEKLILAVAEDIERGDDYFRFLEEKSGIV